MLRCARVALSLSSQGSRAGSSPRAPHSRSGVHVTITQSRVSMCTPARRSPQPFRVSLRACLGKSSRLVSRVAEFDDLCVRALRDGVSTWNQIKWGCTRGMRKEQIRLPGEAASYLWCKHRAPPGAQTPQQPLPILGRLALFIFCQPRLREAVKYNYGWLRCPQTGVGLQGRCRAPVSGSALVVSGAQSPRLRL